MPIKTILICDKCKNKDKSRLFDKICLGCGFDYGNFEKETKNANKNNAN